MLISLKGPFINHEDSKRGRGVPEKTTSVHKGEGGLEAGPHGQNFLLTTTLNAVYMLCTCTVA